MDIKQLQTLAHLKNYSKTAAALNYAPSTITKHIQQLEGELGIALFEKNGRGMTITMQGQRFLTSAQNMLDIYNDAIRTIDDEVSGQNIMVCIGGCDMNLENDAIDIFTSFAAEHSKIHLDMKVTANQEIVSMVREGMLDVGFYYSLKPEPVDGLNNIFLYNEPICLMVPETHPLAGDKRLSYDELAYLTLAVPHESCCFTSELHRRLNERKVPGIQFSYLGNVRIALHQAKQKNAVMVVPYHASKQLELQQMVKLDMKEEPIWAWSRMLCRNQAELTVYSRQLIQYVEQYVKKYRYAVENMQDDSVYRIDHP